MIYNVFVAYLLLISILSIKYKISYKLFYINAVFTLFIYGFRSYDIGSLDTLRYVKFFLGFQGTGYETTEYGFHVFNQILRPFLPYGWMYLFAVDLIALLPLYILIKKYSSNPHISLLAFYCTFRIYEVYIICTRQVIGMSFVLWAIYLFINNIKNKKKYFILLSFIGVSIHTTVLLMAIVFLFLYYIKIPRTVYISICLISYYLFYINFFENLIPILNFLGITGGSLGKFEAYVLNFSDTTFYLHPTIRTIIGIILCISLDKDQYNSIFTKLFLMGIILTNLFSQFAQIYRLSGMFTLFGLIILPWVITSLLSKDKPLIYNQKFKINEFIAKRICIIITFVIILYSYANFKYINDDLSISGFDTPTMLNPYKFFWEDKYNY